MVLRNESLFAVEGEAEVAVDQIACVIGAAVLQAVALALDRAERDRLSISPVPACNSAHRALFA